MKNFEQKKWKFENFVAMLKENRQNCVLVPKPNLITEFNFIFGLKIQNLIVDCEQTKK